MNFSSGRGEGTSEAGKDPELAACVFTFVNSFMPLFNKELWTALYVPGLTLATGERLSPGKIVYS